MTKKILSLILSLLLTFTVGLFAFAEGEESQGEEPPKTPVITKFAIDGGVAVFGHEASIRISVTDNGGLTQFRLPVNFDSEKLAFTGFDKTGTKFDGVTVSSESGISVSYFSSDETDDTGIVCTLKFTLTEKAALGDKIALSINKPSGMVLNGSDQKEFEVSNGSLWIQCENHEFGPDAITDPTCETNGKLVRTCTKCGHQETTDLPAKGHTVEEWKEISLSTCSEAGKREGVCKVCGKTVTAEDALLPHEFGEWVTTVAPTVTQFGEQQRICTKCGFVDMQVMGKCVTEVADLYAGAAIMATGNLSFFGETSLLVTETKFSEMDTDMQKSITEFVKVLDGKQVYTMFEVQFTYEEQPVAFDGSVQILFPVTTSLDGLVIAGEDADGKIVVYNADYKDGCAVFTAPVVLSKYYVLYNKSADTLQVIKDIFSFENDVKVGNTTLPGWIKLAVVALILLLISAGLIVFKVVRDKKIEKLIAAGVSDGAVGEIEVSEFEVSEEMPSDTDTNTPDEDFDED